MPTVTRATLNNADDILREAGLAKFSRARDVHGHGTRASQCDGKAPFTTIRAAEAVARKRTDLSTYRCRYCHQWHVGGRNG